MKNWTYNKWNNAIGWVIFAISFLVYLSTIEPNFSFWDCGEYISSAVKLQVTHAPGAALFQLMGAVAAMFAFGNGEKYSVVINGMSALFSAFTILFLFWTITSFAKKLLKKSFTENESGLNTASLFSGAIGALAFAFSDTFWFSAVEGEVYAMASMFIALIVWLITKWDSAFAENDRDRWIILIFFVIGLSVGVHMMCMLAIPAVCFLYYAKNYQFTWKSFIIANLITLLVLGIIFKGIFPLIMTLFGKMEIFAVNGIGLPFHSGTIIGFVILCALCYFAINFAKKSGKKLYQTIVLSIVFTIIGFSCWMVIPIRANANPPMNLNDPDNAIGMLDYYNREQYGDWPTIYGQNYTAYLDANGIEKNEDGSLKTQKTGDIYEKDEKTGNYRVVDQRFNYVFSKDQVSFMPRMFSEDKDVMANYMSMYGAPKFSYNFSSDDENANQQAQQVFDEMQKKYTDKTIKVTDYLKVKPYDLIHVEKPTFGQNLDYFITFQNYYYNWRYLLWNFAGRQNDVEGHMEDTNGNWISGIDFIDSALWGDQSKMPAKFNNESTVKFFFLPLILGILGLFFQARRDFGRFYAILSLFILTSVGIVFYTGMKPFEPRERDYAMVGSFYAFAIWIGLGAVAVFCFLSQKIKAKNSSLIAGILLLGIPMMMAFQNYNPHDRSQRYTAYDYSYSTLKTLPKNDILFVYGDNDTYPVWAIQETSGLRTDVKVVNFTLLATPWNIDQVKRRTYNAMPVPSTLSHEDYREGRNDQIYLMSKEDWQNMFDNLKKEGAPANVLASMQKYLTQDSMTMKEAINFIKMKSEDKDLVLKSMFGEEKYEKLNFLPVSKFVLPVNKQNAVKAGIISATDAQNSLDNIVVDYKGNSMLKNNLIMLDILANFDWKRPISFSSGGIYDNENVFFLQDYLQMDGFSYRLIPMKNGSKSGDIGRTDGNSLYHTVKNFKWGNFKNLNVHFDETCTQNIMGYRSSASRAAEALALSGQKAKAIELLNLANTEIPVQKYDDPRSLSSIVYGYIIAGQEQKGLQLAEKLQKNILKEYDYYKSMTAEQQHFAARQMQSKPMEYSLVAGAVADAYAKLGNPTKSYEYLLKTLQPIDNRYKDFIEKLKLVGRVKARKDADEIQYISPFYQYIFDVMKPYDTIYPSEKMDQMTKDMMKYAN